MYLILENDHINTDFGATVRQKKPDIEVWMTEHTCDLGVSLVTCV